MTFASAPTALDLRIAERDRFALPPFQPPMRSLTPVPCHAYMPRGQGSPAARIADMVAHSKAKLFAMIAAAVVGAVAVVAVAALVVATGGVGLAVIAAAGAGMAATGGAALKAADVGAKEMGPKTGPIVKACKTVRTNKKDAAHAVKSMVGCAKESAPVPIAEGSDSVLIRGTGAAREGDKIECGATIVAKCSKDVLIGGGTYPYIPVKDELGGWRTVFTVMVYAGSAIAIVAGVGAAAVAVVSAAASGGLVAGGLKLTELAVITFVVAPAIKKGGEEGAQLGARALGYEEGSAVHEMAGIIGGESIGLLRRPGAKATQNTSRYQRGYNSVQTRLQGLAGRAPGYRSANIRTKWAARGLQNKGSAAANHMRNFAAGRMNGMRNGINGARSSLNRGLMTAYLSAHLRFSRPTMPPRPVRPPTHIAAPAPRTPSAVTASMGRIGGASPYKQLPPRVTYSRGKGSFTPKGTAPRSGPVSAKPHVITTIKPNHPSLLVRKQNWSSVKTPGTGKGVKPTATKPPKNAKLPAATRRYVKDIEAQTGRSIHPSQKAGLRDAVRSKDYSKKLSTKDQEIHRKDFDKNRAQIIKDWELNTGQKWPTYTKPVYSKKTGKLLKKVGDKYDAHHIIESNRGGPNKWWNMHPARYPDQHQGGIHRSGAPIREVFPK